VSGKTRKLLDFSPNPDFCNDTPRMSPTVYAHKYRAFVSPPVAISATLFPSYSFLLAGALWSLLRQVRGGVWSAGSLMQTCHARACYCSGLSIDIFRAVLACFESSKHGAYEIWVSFCCGGVTICHRIYEGKQTFLARQQFYPSISILLSISYSNLQ